MPACINDGPQWGCCCWWPRCQITGVDVHRSSPISIEWRQQPSTAKVPAASAVSRQADFSSVFKSRSETMRLERKTLAMDHLSASHARFWRAKRCLLQQSVRDEAIHRLNPHLDHRRAGEEGGTLGGATNKKRWWKKIVPYFFELAPKNGTTFLRGGRESENEHHIQLST